MIKQNTSGCLDNKMINIFMVCTCCRVVMLLTAAEKEL
jgi:hypothetical protein